jgi:hypothetical protein
MKNILILLVLVSSFALSQSTIIGGQVRSYYLKGTPALGATYTNDTFDSSGTFIFGNMNRLELRFKSLDSTFVVVSLWRKNDSPSSQTWTATDSITIHPASGAGADTVWSLRNTVADLPTNTGAQYQFQYRFAASGNWVTQATAASYRVWLNYVGH